MGKTRIEASIQDEAAMLIRHLETHNTNGPSEIGLSVNVAIVNIIWQLLASEYNYTFFEWLVNEIVLRWYYLLEYLYNYEFIDRLM